MRFAVKPWLIKIWHAPEYFRILDPLPPAHRRGIIACAIVISVCFLWPDDAPPPKPQAITLNNDAALPLQANLVVPSYDSSENQSIPQENTSTPPAEAALQNNDEESQWRTYQIAPGQTMAQLFRDNNLPPTDVYAMAQVEGSDKALSNLQAGQTVRIRENEDGVVTGLTIENEKDNRQVHFTRQQDGSFRLGR
ncbi:OapA family protein [Klebsiella sp. BIGb0407]|uniref:OapA family protein n=1 Tax=Klebsiella sp. BIGb0407 TaxID=2940603 RepID=UPI00216A7745|nr:LysM-like peptidoglycan-binding domain-containing protein [Klebsiella sp. BIGb0407]MCS3431448.1 cell envelope opacity-associated protein A [Klebsiella sp. BIGb0407]